MKDRLNSLTNAVIGAALAVHLEVGAGMLESSYEACLAFELVQRGLSFERQKPMPLVYKGHRLDIGYRLDFLVERLVVVEVKAVDRVERVQSAQLLSYLRLTGCKVGLLINFNVRWLVKDGVKRIVNGFPE